MGGQRKRRVIKKSIWLPWLHNCVCDVHKMTSVVFLLTVILTLSTSLQINDDSIIHISDLDVEHV